MPVRAAECGEEGGGVGGDEFEEEEKGMGGRRR